MSLSVVYGRAGSGKSYYCINEIAREICASRRSGENKAPLLLIVPEQFTVQAERMLLAKVPEESIISADVLSFRRMAHRVISSVGGSANKPIDTAGRRIILHRAIEECKEDLRYFKNAAKQRGFVTDMMRLIDELGRYNVDSLVLEEVLGKVQEDSALYDKVREIRLIRDKYDEILHERYIDGRDVLDLLAVKLPEFGALNGARIWIDEFSGFTPQEYRIISELMKMASSVTVTLCCDELEGDYNESDVFAGVKRTFFKLKKLAEENGVAIEKGPRLYGDPMPRFKNSRALSHLEREYFSYPYNIFQGEQDGVQVYAGKSVFSEVEYAACQIVKLVRDFGYRYRDISVVARDLEGYKDAVEIVFERYGIPFFMDMKVDMIKLPLTRLVLAALGAVSENFSYQSMFAYLKTGLLPYPKEIIDVIENIVLARNIRGNRWLDESYWDCSEDTDFSFVDEELQSEINRVREEILAPLVKLKEKLKKDKTIRAMCTALYEFLLEIEMPKVVQGRIDEFEEKNDYVSLSLYTQIWNIVIGIMEQLVETLGDEKTTLAGFQALVEEGCMDYEIGVIPPVLDSVTVGSVERSKNHEIKALFVLGVNEGVFPAAGAKEGILTDSDRAKLEEIGVELAPDSREQTFAEQFLVYSVLTAPSERLYLSYATKDGRGTAQNASEIIRKVRDIFPEIEIKSDVLAKEAFLRPMDSVARKRPALSSLIEVAGELSRGERSASVSFVDFAGDTGFRNVWKSVYDVMRDDVEGSRKIVEARDFYRRSRMKSGRIPEDKVSALFGDRMFTSVSRIEEYVNCPFMYFVDFGLKARERKVMKLAMPDIGNFVHGIVEGFFKEMKAHGVPWEKAMDITENEGIIRDDAGSELINVDRIVDSILKDSKSSIFNDSLRFNYISKRLGRMVNRCIEIMAYQIASGDFEPTYFEAGFGLGSDGFNALEIRDDVGNVVAHLTGRIDRVDIYEKDGKKYFRVIDYKSGNKNFSLGEVYHGLSVQLICYLNAIGKQLEGAYPAGCLYFNVVDSFNRFNTKVKEKDVRNERIKSYKLKGLVLDDPEIVSAMDRAIYGFSKVIPVRMSKNGNVSGSKASKENLDKLSSHVESYIADVVSSIMEGDFKVFPVRYDDKSPCRFCNYSAVCGFDPSREDCSYRFVSKFKKDEDVWRRLE